MPRWSRPGSPPAIALGTEPPAPARMPTSASSATASSRPPMRPPPSTPSCTTSAPSSRTPRPDVEPATLLPGGGEHLAQRGQEPERPVADREHRRAHAAALAAPEQVGPAFGGLAVTVGERDQLLRPVGADPEDHQ